MTPALPDDDAHAEALADQVVEFALRHHPLKSAAFRSRIARLYIKTRLHPETITAATLGELLGEDRRRIPEIEASALVKLRIALRSTHPELFT